MEWSLDSTWVVALGMTAPVGSVTVRRRFVFDGSCAMSSEAVKRIRSAKMRELAMDGCCHSLGMGCKGGIGFLVEGSAGMMADFF